MPPPKRTRRPVWDVSSSSSSGEKIARKEDPASTPTLSRPMHSKLTKFAKVVDPPTVAAAAGAGEGDGGDGNMCVICCENFASPCPYEDGGAGRTGVVVELKCGHRLHHNCAFKLLGDEDFLRCPNCNVVMGVRKGNQPDGGMMTVDLMRHSVQGYRVPTIAITYSFSFKEGMQMNSHPNPGRRFTVRNFPRVAYLPFNDEGKLICEMLKIAFERRLIFTVGTSVTDGTTDTVTWASVHHKTRMTEGAFGYPDPNYFANVRSELAAVGVTPDDVEPMKTIPWDMVWLGAVNFH